MIEGSNTHYFSEVKNLNLFNIGYKERIFESFGSLVNHLPSYHALFVLEPLLRNRKDFKNMLHLNTYDLLTLTKTLDSLSNEFKTKYTACDIMITSYFLNIVGFLCRKYENYNKEHVNKFIPALSKIISYIETNYASNIKLNNLAEIGNISINSVINIFRNNFNITPINYINSLRIQKACQMIIYTDKSLTQIALDTGFCDSNYFSRVFKKIMGKTPSEYRKRDN